MVAELVEIRGVSRRIDERCSTGASPQPRKKPSAAGKKPGSAMCARARSDSRAWVHACPVSSVRKRYPSCHSSDPPLICHGALTDLCTPSRRARAPPRRPGFGASSSSMNPRGTSGGSACADASPYCSKIRACKRPTSASTEPGAHKAAHTHRSACITNNRSMGHACRSRSAPDSMPA